jgi:hypothetical protein
MCEFHFLAPRDFPETAATRWAVPSIRRAGRAYEPGAFPRDHDDAAVAAEHATTNCGPLAHEQWIERDIWPIAGVGIVVGRSRLHDGLKERSGLITQIPSVGQTQHYVLRLPAL